MMKQCSKCRLFQDTYNFRKNKVRKDGLNNWCKDCYKQFRLKFKQKINEQDKQYYYNHKVHKRIVQRDYELRKRLTDINYRLTKNIRARLHAALKNHQKVGSAIKDLGCTVKEFKIYLAAKFQYGMNWENYGKWHIDHIKPLSYFDLSDPKQFLEAVHYTNLQPLWASDNIKKGNKV